MDEKIRFVQLLIVIAPIWCCFCAKLLNFIVRTRWQWHSFHGCFYHLVRGM